MMHDRKESLQIMPTRIKKVGLVNGIKCKSKPYSLSELIQESYQVSYRAKRINNKLLIDLTESHLANIKKDPTAKNLSEDLDVLKGLVKLGKDQTLKDVEEAEAPKKRRKRSINSCVKPATEFKESWCSNKDAMSKALKSFRESAKSKIFFKELDKFNRSIGKRSPITMDESVKLYKASNSCLTHLTIELEKNPSFRKSYKECTKLLSRDNLKLLESIQNGKLPSRSLLESFVAFTNILLESDSPEDLDPEVYEEDADLETLDDRDVINEDADMEELDDRDVIEEDSDMEELDGRDVIDEDADMEELDDRDVINEEEELDPELTEEEEDLDPELTEEDEIDPDKLEDFLDEEEDASGEVPVNLTLEEIGVLKKILSKISAMEESEEPELVDDEELAPELTEEDEEEELDPELTEEDEEEELDPELTEDEDSPVGALQNAKDMINNAIDKLTGGLEEDEDEESDPENEMEFELTESAVNRIKKCF